MELLHLQNESTIGIAHYSVFATLYLRHIFQVFSLRLQFNFFRFCQRFDVLLQLFQFWLFRVFFSIYSEPIKAAADEIMILIHKVYQYLYQMRYNNTH